MKKKDWDKRLINDNSVNKDELELLNQENYLVVKDNNLIQKSTFNFSELELKCLNFAISKLKPDKFYTESDYINFEIKDLLKVLQMSDGAENYKILRETLKRIGEESKWIKIEKLTGIYETAFRFFLKCEIHGNIVKVKFMQEMLDYLQNLDKKFTSMLLVYSINLKSKYSIRLYELSKSYQNNILKRENNTNIYGYKLYIEDIRIKWCLSDKLRYCDIKKILMKSISEINNITDINIKLLGEHKSKRKVIYLELQVFDNDGYKELINSEKLMKKRKEYLNKIKENKNV